MSLSDSSNWELIWESEYTASLTGVSATYYQVIGDVIIPVAPSSNIVAVGISVSFPASYSGYFGGCYQKITAGSFSGNIYPSWKNLYVPKNSSNLSPTPSILIFDSQVTGYSLVVRPIYKIQQVTLEIFEYTGN